MEFTMDPFEEYLGTPPPPDKGWSQKELPTPTEGATLELWCSNREENAQLIGVTDPFQFGEDVTYWVTEDDDPREADRTPIYGGGTQIPERWWRYPPPPS